MSSIHVCVGTGRFFMARCRLPRARRWSWLGPKRQTKKSALMDMVRQWEKTRLRYIEAEVMMAADHYDPITVATLRHK